MLCRDSIRERGRKHEARQDVASQSRRGFCSRCVALFGCTEAYKIGESFWAEASTKRSLQSSRRSGAKRSRRGAPLKNKTIYRRRERRERNYKIAAQIALRGKEKSWLQNNCKRLQPNNPDKIEIKSVLKCQLRKYTNYGLSKAKEGKRQGNSASSVLLCVMCETIFLLQQFFFVNMHGACRYSDEQAELEPTRRVLH